MGKKSPKTAVQVEAVKKPKTASANEPKIGDHPLAWRVSHGDKGGPFAWSALNDGRDYKRVVERLGEFEGMTWAQILETKSHPIETHQLCKEARDRLQEIKLDDLDELMSFRITGAERVWCIKTTHHFKTFWWDPEHKVYPTPIDKADRKKLRNRG